MNRLQRLSRGQGSEPPRTMHIDYWVVVAQLVWRMRLDLILFILLCLGVSSSRNLLEDFYLTQSGLSVLGIAVSIFIAFRNTQAISRWWEARQLWGSMVNVSRQWRDALMAFLPPDRMNSPRALQLLGLQVMQVWTLNFELRNFWRPQLKHKLDELFADLDLPTHLSLQDVCRQRAEGIWRLHSEGWVDDWGRAQLVSVADGALDAIGGLQRIRNTPIPASYDLFVRLICWAYGIELLLKFHQEERSLLIGAALFLGFLVAERIGAYVEGPFDRDGSSFSLPLNAICDTITVDLLQRSLSSHEVPITLDPVRWD